MREKIRHRYCANCGCDLGPYRLDIKCKNCGFMNEWGKRIMGKRKKQVKCLRCGSLFTPTSNRTYYCRKCFGTLFGTVRIIEER